MPDTIPHIRDERPEDVAAIREIERAAFVGHPHHAAGTDPVEPRIVDGLRDAGALLLSLVAESNGEIIGHIAFSPVLVGEQSCGWYGLGPVAVHPGHQRRGIGSALVSEGLARLRARAAGGVVLVGEPAYYGRFGFQNDPRLTFAGLPPEYFLCLPFADTVPTGAVTYHAAFFGV
jgi:putative acetyltransferase